MNTAFGFWCYENAFKEVYENALESFKKMHWNIPKLGKLTMALSSNNKHTHSGGFL